MYKHILFPTDGSRLATKAVTQGIALARAIKAKTTVLHVAPEFQMVIDEGFIMPNAPDLKQRFDAETLRHANKIVDGVKASAKAAGVKCAGVIARGGLPYESILQQARKGKCDLIVMASHGRKGLSSILLGSEASKVLTHSKVAVLVVR
ncbi:MAG: universal stress protein [Burkholderiales bacterium]